jgi:hypothetical protein
VRLSTRCGVVVIHPDGRVERRPAARKDQERWPRGALDRHGDMWLIRLGGHLAVERRGETLWRSARRYRLSGTPHYLEATALGRRAVAFSFSEAALYVARFGEPERVVARGEHPLLWTGAGRLLTYGSHEHGTSLFLRGADGRLLRRLVTRVHNFYIDPESRSVVLVTRSGLLARTDGRRLEPLADVHAFREPALELPGGGLITVFSDSANRLLVLDSGARPFASATIARWPTAAAVSAENEAIAFVVTRWSSDYKRGTDAVVVLRRGARSAVQVYERRHRGSPCGRMAALAWYGHDLLYWTTEGALVVLNSRQARPPVDLTETVAGLPGLWRYGGGAPRLSPEWAAASPG